MTTEPETLTAPTLRVDGPGDLLQAIPYLLGFHPRESLVLVGLSERRLVVTARLDLADLADPPEPADVLADVVRAISRGGAREVIGVVYDDGARPAPAARSGGLLPWHGAAAALEEECGRAGCAMSEALLVASGRWWSYGCSSAECCPSDGRPVPEQPSAFCAAATVAGMVALPDREALAAVLDPDPDGARARLDPLIAGCEDEAVQAVLAGRQAQYERSVKRAIFAAARAAEECTLPGGVGPDDTTVARFGVALTSYATRDAVWMAVDDGRLDGRELWRALARRLPSPYDAAPLFLFGWGSWRSGNGALAQIAAQRAVDSDPGYSAADLLLAALARGVDPRRLPKLRLPRSA
jgi:hypothetical protein